MLLSGMPTGTSELLRVADKKTYVARLFLGAAVAHRKSSYDFLDRLRREVSPLTAEDCVVDWERAFGLTQTATTQFGSLDARQRQVLATWRQSAEAFIPNIQALLAPFFNYADGQTILVIEADRAALRAAHTYATTTTLPLTVNGGNNLGTLRFDVPDDGPVSPAGAWLFLTLTTDLAEETLLTLYAPAARAAFILPGVGEGALASADVAVASRDFLDVQALGEWAVAVRSLTKDITVEAASLFVEAQGYNLAGTSEGLGGAVHTWTVVFEPLKVRPGATADLVGAKAALRAIKPAHTAFSLTVSVNGRLFAIPDTDSAIPDEGIPA